jgi:hypothetical protein
MCVLSVHSAINVSGIDYRCRRFEMIEPVEPSNRETDLTRKGEQAANIVLKYLKGVALVYDVDEKWLILQVKNKLDWELKD